MPSKSSSAKKATNNSSDTATTPNKKSSSTVHTTPASAVKVTPASSAMKSTSKKSKGSKSEQPAATPTPAASTAAKAAGTSNNNIMAPHVHRRQLDVHRLRFGDWVPSAVKSIAVDPTARNMVAVGRVDGDIEIYDSTAKWHQQVRIAGKWSFKLQQLVWSTGNNTSNSSSSSATSRRLFGISLRGFVFEVDLKTLSIANVRDTYGGTAWSVVTTTMPVPATTSSASSSSSSSASTAAGSVAEVMSVLLVGCEDGSIKVFRYDDAGSLEYVRSFPSVGCRVLSLAVGEGGAADGLLYAGCSDGTIRCIDKVTGRQLHHMTGNLLSARGTTGGGRGIHSNTSTHIWSLAVLSDNTIVSGDNRGCVQLWDGRTGVLMQSIHQHTAEVLALAVSPDENYVFASGVDCRVVCIRRIRGALGQSGNDSSPADSQWVYSSAHRPHSHDVFALAVCTVPALPDPTAANAHSSRDSNEVECALLSGGVDTKMCVYGIATFHARRPQWIIPIPPTGRVDSTANIGGGASGEEFKLVAIRHNDRVDIWHVRVASVPAEAKPLWLQHQHQQQPQSASSSGRGDEDALETEEDEEGAGYYGRSDGNSAASSAPSSKRARKKLQKQMVEETLREATATTTTTAATSPSADVSALYGSDQSNCCSLILQLFAVTKGGGGSGNHDHVHTTALSPCGNFLAVSRSAHTSLYRINRPSTKGGAWKVERIGLPDSIAQQLCYRLAFSDPEAVTLGSSSDVAVPAQLALVTARGSLFLLSIIAGGADDQQAGDKDKVVIENCVNHFAQVSNNMTYRHNQYLRQQQQQTGASNQHTSSSSAFNALHYAVSGLKVRSTCSTAQQHTTDAAATNSSGNSWIVVVDSTRHVYVYDIAKRMKLHWAVAAGTERLGANNGSTLVANAEFYHNSRDVLVVLLTDNTLAFYNVAEKRQLPAPWSAFAQQVLNGAAAAMTPGTASASPDPSPSSVTAAAALAASSTIPSSTYFPADLTSYPAALQGLAFIGARSVTNSIANPVIVVYGQGCIVLIHPPALGDAAPAAGGVAETPKGAPQLHPLFQLVKSSAGNLANYQQIVATQLQQARAAVAGATSGKRKHSEVVTAGAAVGSLPPPAVFTMLTCYRSLIHVTAGNVGELVLLENPWVNVLEQLPDTLNRKRYAV